MGVEPFAGHSLFATETCLSFGGVIAMLYFVCLSNDLDCFYGELLSGDVVLYVRADEKDSDVAVVSRIENQAAPLRASSSFTDWFQFFLHVRSSAEAHSMRQSVITIVVFGTFCERESLLLALKKLCAAQGYKLALGLDSSRYDDFSQSLATTADFIVRKDDLASLAHQVRANTIAMNGGRRSALKFLILVLSAQFLGYNFRMVFTGLGAIGWWFSRLLGGKSWTFRAWHRDSDESNGGRLLSVVVNRKDSSVHLWVIVALRFRSRLASADSRSGTLTMNADTEELSLNRAGFVEIMPRRIVAGEGWSSTEMFVIPRHIDGELWVLLMSVNGGVCEFQQSQGLP
jgi:hypothetical protein